MKIIVDAEKCIDCKKCIDACLVNHKTQRIKIVNKGSKNYPILCRQCNKPECARACTYEAIYRNKETNEIYVKEEECQACHACVRACPFDAVFVNSETGIATMCDFCNGDMSCVNVCETGALMSEK